MELFFTRRSNLPSLHKLEHLGQLEVVANLPLRELKDLSVPLQDGEVTEHGMVLQLVFEVFSLCL